MTRRQSEPATIDEYISQCPPDVQVVLARLRATIRRAAPRATETISYRMPAFELHGTLVWFAAFARHIGFYPTGSGVAAFESELGDYVHSKGAIQFPLGEPVPWGLVARIVKFRVKANQAKAAPPKPAAARKTPRKTPRKRA